MEAAVAIISAMCYQEASGYYVVDYLQSNKHLILDVDPESREKMVAWSFQVVDFCKFHRETVEIAMSYLDRFLLTPPGHHTLHDRSLYQLAAMASLYTAVKIHEPEAMDPKLVSNLSRGTYSTKDIEEMELIILQALQWRLNPPTTLSYIREFFNLVPPEALDTTTKTIVYDLTQFQSELATSSHLFVGITSAEKAYCCFISALQSLEFDPKIIQYIDSMLLDAIGASNKTHSERTLNAKKLLYAAVVEHPLVKARGLTTQSPKRQRKPRSEVTISPRTSILHMNS
jgi:Cyclin, N-terminal domain